MHGQRLGPSKYPLPPTHCQSVLGCLILRGLPQPLGGLSLLTCEMGLRTALDSTPLRAVVPIKGDGMCNVYSWCLVLVICVHPLLESLSLTPPPPTPQTANKLRSQEQG